VSLARARPADEHRVVRGLDELAGVQGSNQCFIDAGLRELEPRKITMRREARRPHLVGHGAHRPFGRLGLERSTIVLTA
jgi:hypothetical protein